METVGVALRWCCDEIVLQWKWQVVLVKEWEKGQSPVCCRFNDGFIMSVSFILLLFVWFSLAVSLLLVLPVGFSCCRFFDVSSAKSTTKGRHNRVTNDRTTTDRTTTSFLVGISLIGMVGMVGMSDF